MNPRLSNIITFISSLLIGIFGTYYANRLSDKARQKNLTKDRKRLFQDIKFKMPDLIKEMQDDLKSSQGDLCRDFYILGKRSILYQIGGAAFSYYEEDYKNLKSKIRILLNTGFIFDITETALPKYQFEEEYVEYLKENNNKLSSANKKSSF